jgi:hypothetical protein
LREIKPYDASVLEPCIGDGAIVQVLRNYTSDIDWCEIQLGRDFLTYEPDRRYDWVITNPPYTLAKEFIDHAYTMADNVVMLLRVNFLESLKRKMWWEQHKPSHIYVLSKRPSFTGNGTDATGYMWCRWQPNQPYAGTQLYWL